MIYTSLQWLFGSSFLLGMEYIFFILIYTSLAFIVYYSFEFRQNINSEFYEMTQDTIIFINSRCHLWVARYKKILVSEFFWSYCNDEEKDTIEHFLCQFRLSLWRDEKGIPFIMTMNSPNFLSLQKLLLLRNVSINNRAYFQNLMTSLPVHSAKFPSNQKPLVLRRRSIHNIPWLWILFLHNLSLNFKVWWPHLTRCGHLFGDMGQVYLSPKFLSNRKRLL